MGDRKATRVKQANSNMPNNGIYGILAFIGAAVYYIQQADGFGEIVVALLKAIIWPALLVYELLGFLKM